MTNWSYWEAVRRFQRVLEVSGVNASLKSRGIQVRLLTHCLNLDAIYTHFLMHKSF